ncbi:MAG: pantetheine-phosphate adenylyltransferase [Thermoplasmatota archaeon]
MEEQMENICLGGTFSPIHSGHMRLLEEAFQRGKRVSVGLTSDEMATRDRKRKVDPFEDRRRDLMSIMDRLSERFSVPYSISEINDRFGFATMAEIDSIVVSQETESTVDEIDEERAREGLPPLKRFVVEMVTDRNGRKLSSTRVDSGEIDGDGNILGNGNQDQNHRRICVHLGSKNQDKAEGVISAFRRYSAGIQLLQYNVGEGRTSNRLDILEGARDRSREARERNSNVSISPFDYFVGIEAGPVLMKGSWFLVHGCHILNDGYEGLGISSGLEIPPEILERIMVYRGRSWETRDILGSRTSLVENLSGGTLSRRDLVEQACRMALLSLTNAKKGGTDRDG